METLTHSDLDTAAKLMIVSTRPAFVLFFPFLFSLFLSFIPVPLVDAGVPPIILARCKLPS